MCYKPVIYDPYNKLKLYNKCQFAVSSNIMDCCCTAKNNWNDSDLEHKLQMAALALT